MEPLRSRMIEGYTCPFVTALVMLVSLHTFFLRKRRRRKDDPAPCKCFHLGLSDTLITWILRDHPVTSINFRLWDGP